LLELKKIKPLGICFSLECFDNKNREYFLRDVKRDLDLDTIKERLIFANDLGIRTNFSYIIGLESLETIKKGFCEFLPYTNSFPIVNAFQAHKGNVHSWSIHFFTYYIAYSILTGTPPALREH